MAITIKELPIVLHIVNARKDFLEVAQSELLLLKVENDVQVVFRSQVLFALEQLPDQFAEVCVAWQLTDHGIVPIVLAIETE